MKSSEQLRQDYIKFWSSHPRNSKQVENVSLVPNNDPTLLFVNSGMFPLVPYLGGQTHPLGKRIFNVQRCVRTNDIEEVGDYNHLTLFEMIGSWSLGDFTKADQIPWKLDLYVNHFGLDPARIYASVWGGDSTVPRDDEAIEIWKKAFREYGIEAEFSEDISNVPQGDDPSTKDWKFRIFPFGKKDNWWQRGPDTAGELGGPTSEIFYDMGKPIYETSEALNINDDSGRYLEVGNSVFMEYQFQANGKWEQMEQKNIDFGGGLDRIVATVQGVRSVYETDLFMAYIKIVEKLSGKIYDNNDQNSKLTKSIRIIVEHARSATFMMADGVIAGNKDQGHILRRLVRRMIRHGLSIGITGNFTVELAKAVIEKMSGAYPHLKENEAFILDELDAEEIKFRRTLERGLKELQDLKIKESNIDGKIAFYIYETYGFPFEMILEELDIQESKIAEITESFNLSMEEHRSQSRAGAESKFKGGLADQSVETTKLHTAHHLLLKALQEIVDAGILQKGSNITGERLRIDFNASSKLTPEQIEKVENLVNEKIEKGLNVLRIEMPKDKASELGAQMEFGQKYPELVSVYFVTEESTDGIPNTWFSAEFCGGPHVANTSEIGTGGKKFKIYKQESVGSGIKRIKAMLE